MKNQTRWCHLLAILFLISFHLSCVSSDNTDPLEPEEEIPVVEYLKVLNYNVRYFNPPSTPSNSVDIEPVVDVIDGIKPDIVALQEVDVNTIRSGNRNLASEIAGRLRMRYFFAKAIDYQSGDYGVLILSRFPISEGTIHRLPSDPDIGGEPRILATAKITLPDGTEIRFGNTHMDALADPTNRRMQAERIVEIAENESLPFIVAGDFNAVPEAQEVKTLLSHFTNSCVSCAPTFPAISPNRIIDYIIYHSADNILSVESHQVINESFASDHRPVFTEFKLN